MIAALLIAGVAIASESPLMPIQCDTISIIDTLYMDRGGAVVTDTATYQICPVNCTLDDLKGDIRQLQKILKARKDK